MSVLFRDEVQVTFPGMWTNTCCSHQLLGQEPSEVDGGQNDVASGTVPGARHAAVRKLLHELGIPSQQVTKHFQCQPMTTAAAGPVNGYV